MTSREPSRNLASVHPVHLLSDDPSDVNSVLFRRRSGERKVRSGVPEKRGRGRKVRASIRRVVTSVDSAPSSHKTPRRGCMRGARAFSAAPDLHIRSLREEDERLASFVVGSNRSAGSAGSAWSQRSTRVSSGRCVSQRDRTAFSRQRPLVRRCDWPCRRYRKLHRVAKIRPP